MHFRNLHTPRPRHGKTIVIIGSKSNKFERWDFTCKLWYKPILFAYEILFDNMIEICFSKVKQETPTYFIFAKTLRFSRKFAFFLPQVSKIHLVLNILAIKMKYLAIVLTFSIIVIGKTEYEFLGSVVNWRHLENEEVGLK